MHAPPNYNIDPQIVDRARSVRIEDEIARRGIKLRGKVDRYGPCPLCGGRNRFAINTRKRVWNCRGCRKGGDVIDLVRHLDGVDFLTAVATLTGGETSPSTGKPRRVAQCQPVETGADDHERLQRDKARRLWSASRAANGTMVENYLRRARGITVPLPASLRFLPPLKPGQHPAMLVPYGLATEPEPGILDIAKAAICAVQLTRLKHDGSGKADIEKPKINIASPAGMPMVIAPVNDLLGLAICEGVEDALSAHQATGLGAWATGGAGFMPKIADAVPGYVEAVTIFAHVDEAGQFGARELADALVARGIEVRIEGVKP